MLAPDFTTLPDQQIHDKLICIVCTEPIDDPRMHSCGNMFCKQCLPIPILKRCPGCNVEFKSQTEFDNPVPMLAKNMLDEIEVKCVHCGECMKRAKALEHKNRYCPERTVPCERVFQKWNGRLQKGNELFTIMELYRTCSGRCSWKGKPEQLESHKCEVVRLCKAASLSFILILNAGLYNFVDPEECNSSTGWIEVSKPQAEGDQLKFEYVNPHSKDSVVEYLSRDHERYGQYYLFGADSNPVLHHVIHCPPPPPPQTRSKKRKNEGQSVE